MNNMQRKFFEDPRRYVLCLGRRHGRTAYMQNVNQALRRKAEAKNNFNLIAIDECKEFTQQDVEKLRRLMNETER